MGARGGGGFKSRWDLRLTRPAVRRDDAAVSEPPDRMTRAPFDAEQIASINAYQQCATFHPFTCGRLLPDGSGCCDGLLVATETGMVCEKLDCPYVQDWVHPFMANDGWREHAATVRWLPHT